MSDSLIPSFLVSNVSESLRSLTKNERRSEWLIFLTKSLIRSFLDTSDSLGKPMSEFPALDFCKDVCKNAFISILKLLSSHSYGMRYSFQYCNTVHM